MCVRSDWYAKGTSEAEVGEFNGSLVVNEKVLRFQVAVDNPPRVTENDTFENLICVTLREREREREREGGRERERFKYFSGLF